jgi:predicted DsbA family dithiol-disulfide isomerase
MTQENKMAAYPTAHGAAGGVETASVQILFVTDPICSHCWAMEPAWRRFLYLYGEHVEVSHLYGGLLPHWDGFADVGAGIRAPADIPPHWDEVVERYGQPIDASVWLTDPLASSYPPSVAVHAVRALAPEREEAYLRRIRQALFLKARNIARREVLIDCAADIGLDPDRFAAALDDPASEAGFAADLAAKVRSGIRGFPTLVVTGQAGEQPRMMRGSQPFFRLERALEAMLGELPPAREVSVEDVLREYGTGTTREFSEVLGLDEEATSVALQRAGARSRMLAGSRLWSAE